MEQSRDHILQMVSSGAITAEEADRLLSAIEGPPAPQTTPSAGPAPAADLPRIGDLRRGWRLPFLGSIFLAALSLNKIVAGRGREDFFSRLGRGLYRVLFAIAATAALFFLWSRDARWLYLKIEQEDGRRFAFSLPVPVGLLARLLGLARRFSTDPAASEQLDAAAGFIREMQAEMDAPGSQPLTIDIHDKGQRVQVYFL